MNINMGFFCEVCGSEDRLVWVSPSFLFSCWKTYGKYDNLSNLAGVGLCVTSEQGKLCKIRNAFPTHFPLRQGFSRGVEIHAELPWKSTSFLSQMKSASEPVPAGHTHCVRQAPAHSLGWL